MEERIEVVETVKEDGLIHEVFKYMMEHDPNFREFVENHKTEFK